MDNGNMEIGEGNGTPLQYSCLENPMDGGAWWAAVHGVATERLHFHFSLSCIGEGNGNPLQCSCLENPRDGGAWWAAICGVAQSRTQLKRLSSSSNYMSLKLRSICVHKLNVEKWESSTSLTMLSRFSRVRLCATSETAAHQAPPSLGFSRQERWSGLPFPPPMHESEK